MAIVIAVAAKASVQNARPTIIPSEAVTHTAAAVVSPVNFP